MIQIHPLQKIALCAIRVAAKVKEDRLLSRAAVIGSLVFHGDEALRMHMDRFDVC